MKRDYLKYGLIGGLVLLAYFSLTAPPQTAPMRVQGVELCADALKLKAAMPNVSDQELLDMGMCDPARLDENLEQVRRNSYRDTN